MFENLFSSHLFEPLKQSYEKMCLNKIIHKFPGGVLFQFKAYII